jgi:hypothetical protein
MVTFRIMVTGTVLLTFVIILMFIEKGLISSI